MNPEPDDRLNHGVDLKSALPNGIENIFDPVGR